MARFVVAIQHKAEECFRAGDATNIHPELAIDRFVPYRTSRLRVSPELRLQPSSPVAKASFEDEEPPGAEARNGPGWRAGGGQLQETRIL